MHLLYPFAKRFIAGENPQTALTAICKLHDAGFLSSADILGENVNSREQAVSAKDLYVELLRKFEPIDFPMDFSVKLSQMGLGIDNNFCRQNLEAILTTAGKNTVRFDMEDSSQTQATLEMCLKLHTKYDNLGQAVQAYLFRTEADVDQLIENKISVRLCKGAYKEDASIAYTSMDDIRANFLSLGYKLLKEGNIPSIATHDEYLLLKILSFVEKENIAPESFYFEMLYGVARDLQNTLLKKGYQVRIYTPFGKTWLPYTIRRLLEKKENMLFVMTNIFKEFFRLRKIK